MSFIHSLQTTEALVTGTISIRDVATMPQSITVTVSVADKYPTIQPVYNKRQIKTSLILF